MIDPAMEDRLAATALDLARDIREDLAQAHRTIRYMNRAELEAVVCVLAAAFPVDVPFAQVAWWRTLDVATDGVAA